MQDSLPAGKLAGIFSAGRPATRTIHPFNSCQFNELDEFPCGRRAGNSCHGVREIVLKWQETVAADRIAILFLTGRISVAGWIVTKFGSSGAAARSVCGFFASAHEPPLSAYGNRPGHDGAEIGVNLIAIRSRPARGKRLVLRGAAVCD
jgi:hypothetical protein